MSDDSVTGDSASDLRRTALHGLHVRLGGRLVPFAGFEMPVQYSSIKEEHEAVRERAGLFDVSHMGQLELTGPGACAALEKLVTCPVATLGIDRARYGLMLNEDGGCIDDVMLTRVAEEAYFLCVNASNKEAVRNWIKHCLTTGLCEKADKVVLKDRSSETALIAIQGPAARGLLERLLSEGSKLPKRFRISRCEIAGIRLLASGTGYTGSPGFELYVGNADATRLFEALLEAGQPDGVIAAGLGARDTLRLEAALPLYGHELDATTSPFEAGLDRFVKPLESGFIGAAALERRNSEPDPRRLVGFEMVGRGIARADYEIAVAGSVIGRVTSGAPSPTLGKSIGLGYVPRSRSEVGSPFEIVIRKKAVEARVTELPFLR